MAERLNEKILLDSIKNKWLESTGNIEMEYDATVSKTKGKYYFKELEKNLIPKGMGENAKKDYGKDWRMRALYSSAAMTFNIFGNDTVEIGNNNPLGLTAGKYKIEYEKKLPTGVNSAKANIDACLTSEFGEKNEIVFFEMKMTEWLLNVPKKLPKAYIEDSSIEKLFSRKFIDSFINLGEIRENKGKLYYPSKNNYFDVIQIMLHILGFYNALKKGDFGNVKKATLICGVWEIEDKEFFKEKKDEQIKKYEQIKKEADAEFKTFYDELNKIQPIFKNQNINVSFDIKKASVSDIITSLNKTDKGYLKRYLTK